MTDTTYKAGHMFAMAPWNETQGGKRPIGLFKLKEDIDADLLTAAIAEGYKTYRHMEPPGIDRLVDEGKLERVHLTIVNFDTFMGGVTLDEVPPVEPEWD